MPPVFYGLKKNKTIEIDLILKTGTRYCGRIGNEVLKLLKFMIFILKNVLDSQIGVVYNHKCV